MTQPSHAFIAVSSQKQPDLLFFFPFPSKLWILSRKDPRPLALVPVIHSIVQIFGHQRDLCRVIPFVNKLLLLSCMSKMLAENTKPITKFKELYWKEHEVGLSSWNFIFSDSELHRYHRRRWCTWLGIKILLYFCISPPSSLVLLRGDGVGGGWSSCRDAWHWKQSDDSMCDSSSGSIKQAECLTVNNSSLDTGQFSWVRIEKMYSFQKLIQNRKGENIVLSGNVLTLIST